MKHTAIRRGTLVGLVVLSTACGGSAPAESNGVITFEWEGGVASARGARQGRSQRVLSVRYNVIMQFTDFEMRIV